MNSLNPRDLGASLTKLIQVGRRRQPQRARGAPSNLLDRPLFRVSLAGSGQCLMPCLTRGPSTEVAFVRLSQPHFDRHSSPPGDLYAVFGTLLAKLFSALPSVQIQRRAAAADRRCIPVLARHLVHAGPRASLRRTTHVILHVRENTSRPECPANPSQNSDGLLPPPAFLNQAALVPTHRSVS